MNERIRELTGQALDQAMPQTWYGISPDDLDRIMAKFAELIIKETLQVARAGIEFGDGMEDAVYKYFGVKE